MRGPRVNWGAIRAINNKSEAKDKCRGRLKLAKEMN